METKFNIKTSKIISVAQTNVPDCFVLKNKIGTAHGEAKLYIGGSTIKDWNLFFNGFNIQGIILKEDLLTYLELAKEEYETQSQGYREDISSSWLSHYNIVSTLNEVEFFDFYHKDYKNLSRYYVNSESGIYTLLRKICLPIMTSIVIEIIENNGRVYAWFRPFINSIGNIYEHEITEGQEKSVENDLTIDTTTKQQIILARKGQGKFRVQLMRKFNSTCAITGVNDERILIASHIKPWTVSDNFERLSEENGIILSPVFDRLFDKGFIAFKDNGNIILSDYFSAENFKRLNIDESIKCKFNVSITMKNNLDYHRDQVFKH